MRRHPWLYQIRQIFSAGQLEQDCDAELLDNYCRTRSESAFTALVQRHGPLVWRVCRRMLRDEHLCEDVFQATFLVLSRRAHTIRQPEALIGWLHGVSTRLALKARLHESRRRHDDLATEPPAPDSVDEMTVRELREVLDEELLRLPDKLRCPLVLCYLEGKTRDEAAQQLGCPLETLKSRLEKGRELLRDRLSRRHVALASALLSIVLAEGPAQAAPPAALVYQTSRGALHFAGGLPVPGEVSARAVRLSEGWLSSIKAARLKTAVVVAAVLLVGVLTVRELMLGGGRGRPAGGAPPSVFEGPPAPHVARLRADLPGAGGPLRQLIVEERVGVRRQQELVRVPLFFHEGECQEPADVQIFAAADLHTPLVSQPDDIRRAEDGSVSRMHLYFATDLQPWETKQFVLVRGQAHAAAEPAVACNTDEPGRVTLAGNDLQLTFWSDGPRTGGIAAIRTSAGKVTLADELLAPSLFLQRQDANLGLVRGSEVSYERPESFEVRDLRFGAGPLFAKLVVRIGPRGLPDSAEYVYLVPRMGSHFIQSQRLLPDEESTSDVVGAGSNTLLAGRITLGDRNEHCKVVPVPAGLRRLTRSTRGHANDALVNAHDGISMLAVPWVQGGIAGMECKDDGQFALQGSPHFRRTPEGQSAALRTFFGQVRVVFARATDVDALWDISRAHFQPLTAVVEEPGVTSADLHGRLKQLMEQFPATHARSWMQEAGRLYTLDDAAALDKLLTADRAAETTVEHWLGSARAARAQFTEPLNEDDKGKSSGLLHPWNLTYQATPMVALAGRLPANDQLARISAAIGKAQRQFNGRVDAAGFPYIDCYQSSFHMQLGSDAAGLLGAGKTGDDELAQYYRDCCRAPGVLDVFGHGQRDNQTLPGGRHDFLHASTSDYYLRVIELTCNEDLWLHPAVYGRYFDCLDVNADLYQRTLTPGKRPTSWYRAAYARGQAHDRRWEAWGAAPFLGMLRHPEGTPLGLTEACYHAEHLIGQPLNWVEITTFFQADHALREGLKGYRKLSAPDLPANVKVAREPAGNRVTWQALPEAQRAQGYRVYRSERDGGPWVLLNSPYTTPSGSLVPGAEHLDAGGQPHHRYHVTAIDAKRRESPWFTSERGPRAVAPR